MPLSDIHHALIVAPHADDEVLGCGGTIARLVDLNATVDVAVVTSGTPPAYREEEVAEVRAESAMAHRILGVSETVFLGLPAASLDTKPHAEVNRAIEEVVRRRAPDTLFVPFGGDIHLDHKLVFLSSLVAARPNRADYPLRLWAHETLSETNWQAPGLGLPFVPTPVHRHRVQPGAQAASDACLRITGAELPPRAFAGSDRSSRADARRRGSSTCGGSLRRPARRALISGLPPVAPAGRNGPSRNGKGPRCWRSE